MSHDSHHYYSLRGYQAGVDTPDAPREKFSDASGCLPPENFDRVAFERELKGQFAARGPSLRHIEREDRSIDRL